MAKIRFPIQLQRSEVLMVFEPENQNQNALYEIDFQMLADNVPVMIWISDVTKLCFYFNQPWLDFTGKTLDQEVGLGWASNVHPDDLERCLETYTSSFDARRRFEMEYRLRRHDGEYRPVLDYGIPYFAASGEFKGYIGSCIDITEQKRVEEALRESDERYRLLFESNPIPTWVIDVENHRFLAVNAAAVKHYGYTRAEFLEMNGKDVRTPEEIPKFVALMEKLKFSDLLMPICLKHRKKGGEAIDVEIFYNKIFYQKRPALLSVIQNVTEREKNKERIHKLAALLDKTKDAILVCDLNYRILYWNKGAELLYGWQAEEALDKEICELIYGGDKFLVDAAKNALEVKDEWKTNVRQVTKTKQTLIVESRWEIIRNEQNIPDYILITNTDITEQKQIEEHLLRAQRMESIGKLAGGIAHDLNNILAPILMTVEMLETEVFDETTTDRLRLIKENAERGADLVKQVLTFAGGLKGERVMLHLKHAIEDLINVLHQTFPKCITIKYTVKPDLWSIFADPTQIHQVLLNISLNARDAMINGGILKITAENAVLDEHYARMQAGVDAGKYVLITISDTGTGIESELQSQIFDPFFTTKEPGKGTGLGLSTALSIVKSHGGLIDFCSIPGEGTKFSIYLPAAESSEVYEEQSRETHYPQGNGETILLVDDEENILNITKQTLEKFGYRVLTAKDGTDAVAVYTQNEADIALVITDLAMPNLDGVGVVRVLRRLKPEIKIVVTSGLISSEQTAELQVLSVNAHLTKPYTTEKLLQTVAAVLIPNQSFVANN